MTRPLPLKVACVTGTRADYGLLYHTLLKLSERDEFKLQLLVTGTHLSPEHGTTISEIEDDGIPISESVEILLSADTETGLATSTALALMGCAQAFKRLAPDLLLLLGDRFEAFAAASAATLCRIPIVHFHGGETTEGAFDEAFRHSITKMSHLHLVSTEDYRRRVIQLGEDPTRVFHVGAPGLEGIQSKPVLPFETLQADLKLPWEKQSYLMVTFHPVTLQASFGVQQVNSLLSALRRFPQLNLLFTLPNADAENKAIAQCIKKFVEDQPERSACFASLGRVRYHSAVYYSRGVVGNSSSGLIEAPSLGVGTVNIGDRQKGRVAGHTVIHCASEADSIARAIEKLLSPPFQEKLSAAANPYWNGPVSGRVLDILLATDFSNILKKRFHDITKLENREKEFADSHHS